MESLIDTTARLSCRDRVAVISEYVLEKRGTTLLIGLQPTSVQRTHGICMRGDGHMPLILSESALCSQESVHLLSSWTSAHDTAQDCQNCCARCGHRRDSERAPGAGSYWNRCRGSSSACTSDSTPACTTSRTASALETVRFRFPGPGSSQDAFNPFPCCQSDRYALSYILRLSVAFKDSSKTNFDGQA